MKESVKNFQKFNVSAAGEKAFLSKGQCFDFIARLPNRASPDCPYLGLSCRNFYINLGCGVCFQREDGVRCSWLPSWVTSGKDSIFAVLKKDGRLHV